MTLPPNADPSHQEAAATGPDDLQLFWELAAELFCVLAPDGRFLHVNPAWTRVLGWREDELLGRNAFELVHPDDRATTSDASERALAEGQRQDEFQNRYRHRDGSYRWLSWTGHLRGDRWFGTARDITTMRMSHDALQRSERRSRAMLAALRDGLIIIDADGRVTEVSDRFAEMVGMPASEILGLRAPFPWWPPEELEWITRQFGIALQSEHVTHELTFMRANGERFPVIIDTSELPERGRRNTMLSVIRDASELVATRDRLAEAHRVAGLLAWEWFPDRDEVVVYENPLDDRPQSTYTMTTAESTDYIPEPARSTLTRLREEVARGERESFVLELPTAGPAQTGWVEVRAEQLRAPDGRILGVRGTAQSIDARKRAEFEARLQSDILDAIDVAVIARGPDQKLVFANDAAIRLLGWPREELEGTGPDDVKLIAPGQQETEALIAALKEGTEWEGELLLRRRDGSRVRTRVRTAAVRDETGAPQYVAGIVVVLGDPDTPAD